MATTVSIDNVPERIGAPDLRTKRSWRQAKSHLMVGLMVLSFVLVLIPLVAVLATVIKRGGKVISVDFLTKDIPVRSRLPGPGMGPAVVGTLLTTFVASALAVPLGILGAVYLNEYGRTDRLARAVRFMANVMAGVPSIVMGLFVFVIFTLRFGFSTFGASLALAFLMLPIVIRATEEMLRLVPNHLREASMALGASKSRTIITVVLPSALSGIVSGSLLAIARAAGETAPVYFTIGFAKTLNVNIFSGENTTLAAQIFDNARQPFPGANDRAWGAALTLVVIAFVFTLVARLFTARLTRKR
ncbi:MAG: phosphate ABC transporter permease PstA [Acidimicrobiia bacterium]